MQFLTSPTAHAIQRALGLNPDQPKTADQLAAILGDGASRYQIPQFALHAPAATNRSSVFATLPTTQAETRDNHLEFPQSALVVGFRVTVKPKTFAAFAVDVDDLLVKMTVDKTTLKTGSGESDSQLQGIVVDDFVSLGSIGITQGSLWMLVLESERPILRFTLRSRYAPDESHSGITGDVTAEIACLWIPLPPR